MMHHASVAARLVAALVGEEDSNISILEHAVGEVDQQSIGENLGTCIARPDQALHKHCSHDEAVGVKREPAVLHSLPHGFPILLSLRMPMAYH